jgi:hypothetical protein
MTMVGFLVTLIKAGLVFGLLAVTIKMLRRYDRRSGTGGGRRAGRSRRGGGAGGRSRRARHDERVLEIVERAPVGRASSVLLVRVQDQHWVLGVTEQQISMLLEVDLPEVAEDTIDLRAEATPMAALGLKAWQQLARHARQYLPGGQKVELLEPPGVVTAGPAPSTPEQPVTNGRLEDVAPHTNHEIGS